MAVNLIIYDAQRHKMARPITTRQAYLALRDSEAQRANLAAARQGNKAAKRRLVQMNYSLAAPTQPLSDEEVGEFPLKGATTVGNSVGMDIDHIAPDAMQPTIDKILAMKEELGLLMLERSARGEGLHVVFGRHPEMSNEENLRWASERLGVEFDKGAKDVTRVFYTTTASDEELLYLDDALFDTACCTIGQEADETNTSIAESQTGVSDTNSEAATTAAPVSIDTDSYMGIEYQQIIDKYWEMFNNGATPVVSNRDTLTYELANMMKHICGFDRQLLDKVIPCYDGFPEAEKMKCIDSALSGKRTQMPKRLREVLEALRRKTLISNNGLQQAAALDEAFAQDELFFYNSMPRAVLVQGIKESIDAAGQTLAMPVITAICPAIGARATGVTLDVHGKPNTLNLIAYVAGDFASGKGQMDDVVKAWMSEDIAMASLYDQQWAEWRDKYKRSRNKKDLPVEPKLPKVWLTLNNTTANLAEELSNVQGRHAFSFTPEADVVSMKWKNSVSDFSAMIRLAYDAAPYDRAARSVDAVNVHIPKLMWNVVMCGTPDALYRVVTNYTDGFQSRIAVARTPDNTFQKLEDNPAHLTEYQKEKIEQVSHLLPLMKGNIVLPKLEAHARKWLEEIRIETMKNDDRVMARQRIRVCVTAQRMTCCLMLAAVAAKLIKDHGLNGAEARLKREDELWQQLIDRMQTPAFLAMFDLIADTLIDNAMYFFRERIEQAFGARSYAGNNKQMGNRARKGKNDTIYSRLSQEFTLADAIEQSIAVKGPDVTNNAVTQMIKNWLKQGLIEQIDNGLYAKLA